MPSIRDLPPSLAGSKYPFPTTELSPGVCLELRAPHVLRGCSTPTWSGVLRSNANLQLYVLEHTVPG